MQVTIFNSQEILARWAARKIIDLVTQKPNAVLCLAAGETPRLTYQYLVEFVKKEGIDFSAVQYVSLDEWVDIAPSNTGSCYYFLRQCLFDPLLINPGNIHFFNSIKSELPASCEKINRVIERLNGIDLALLGTGMNGHIGFNEPNIPVDLLAHVVELDPITRQVGQKYFSENTALHSGISLGMSQIMQSGTILLLATGQKKAAIMKKALEENVSMAVPASFVQHHTNAFVLLDQEAAHLLTKAYRAEI
jgi:glucosamine-6-phosphate isomerase